MAESPTCMGALGSACHQLSQETAPHHHTVREQDGKHAAGPGPGARRCPAVLVSTRTVAARRRCPQLPQGWLGGLNTRSRKSTCSQDVGVGAKRPPCCWPAVWPGWAAWPSGPRSAPPAPGQEGPRPRAGPSAPPAGLLLQQQGSLTASPRHREPELRFPNKEDVKCAHGSYRQPSLSR